MAGWVCIPYFQIAYKMIQSMCKYVTYTRFTFHMHDLELWALLYSLTDEGTMIFIRFTSEH